MSLIEKQDYVFYPGGIMMNSKSPMKNVDVCVVSTKNKIFFVPKKTTSIYVVLTTIKTHRFFDGVSIEDGVKRIIGESTNVSELEKNMTDLLENDDKYVHNISDKSSFKFRGFLGRHTLRMSTGGMNWATVSPSGRGNSKEFRTFHGQ